MSAKAAEKAAKVAEKIEPVVEDTFVVVETLERIPKLALNGTTKQQQILILAFTALGGAAAATAVCVTVFKKRYQAKYAAIADQEIADARSFFQATSRKPELSDLVAELPVDSKVDAAANAFTRYQTGAHASPVDDESTTHNIFVEGKPMDEGFDYEAEIALRSIDAPYIISKDEYNQGEKEFDQEELTYYEGDDVLADSKGKHIPDTDDSVGDANLHRFGHGSGDNNILYVRNERLELDFVILKSMGEYAKEVLGLRHSDEHHGPRKARRSDWGDDG